MVSIFYSIKEISRLIPEADTVSGRTPLIIGAGEKKLKKINVFY